jgi:Uncharacterised nucleotidyltransferase
MARRKKQGVFWNSILVGEQSVLYALCACLRSDVSPQADWEKIIGMANRTLVTPALAESVRHDAALPSDVKDFLGLIRHQAIARNTMMFAQLQEALTAISATGVRPILLKGAAFLAQAEDIDASRICSDLDILVGQENLDLTIEALQSIGYLRDGVNSDVQDGANLARTQDAGSVDLHCRLKTIFPRYSYADIAPACAEISLGSTKALIPSAAFQTAILILHDQLQERDYWRGLIDLRHLLDIKRLDETQGGIDWDAVLALFPNGHAARALHTQLATIEHFLGMPMPQATRENRAARWQLWRRRTQLDYKWLGPTFTLFSLLIDPPRRPPGSNDGTGTQVTQTQSRSTRILRMLGRHFGQPSIKKV